MLAFDYRLALIAIAVFVGITAITRYVSLASLVLSLLLPVWMLLFYKGDIHMLIVACIFTILAFIKHRSNIQRLFNGSENKIGQKVKVK